MESYLLASKAALLNLPAYEKICIVLGNETCDLDSAVSTLVQAYSEYLDGIKEKKTDLAVIPLMNIHESDYRVKTEVVFFLKRHRIPFDLLTFRNQIDLKGLRGDVGKKLELILVDHHDLPDEDIDLMDFVVKIIDHRPRDERWIWPGRKVYLENVGSCATLVARNLFDKHPEVIDSQLSSLLRGPILIDTSNLSKVVDRVTPADIEVVEALEKAGELDLDRGKVFNEIVNAKSDISELTACDLLIRDLKVTVGIPIVGLPILVKNFLDLKDSLESVENFANSRNFTIIVLIGLEVRSNTVSRDIAIFSLTDNRLKEMIIEALTVSVEPALELTFIREIEEQGGKFRLVLYRQGNVRATRKQILPIIRDIVLSKGGRCYNTHKPELS